MKLILCDKAISIISQQANNSFESVKKIDLKFPEEIKKENWKEKINPNFKLICKSINENDNVYAFFDNYDNVLYIGKSHKIKNRLYQHLVYCSKKTNSKLKIIQKYCIVDRNQSIKIATLQVEPKEYYQLIEGILIKKYNPKWNNRND